MQTHDLHPDICIIKDVQIIWGLTGKQLSTIIGVSEQKWSRWQRGRVTPNALALLSARDKAVAYSQQRLKDLPHTDVTSLPQPGSGHEAGKGPVASPNTPPLPASPSLQSEQGPEK